MRSNLKSAEQTLSDTRQKKAEAEVVRDVGIGISFIPFFGLFAGK